MARNIEEYESNLEQHHRELVTDYEYLGVNINERNMQESEINQRIASYNKNVNMLYPLLKDQSVLRESKTIIYNAILKPVIMYGSETWSLTSNTESKIQAAEMRVLRLIKGVTQRDRCRNKSVRAELKVEPLLWSIKKGRLRWYGHVKRMNKEMCAAKYLEWKPQRKRPVGHPRRRWKGGVDRALKKRGTSLAEVEALRLNDDREERRKLHKLAS